MKNCVRLACEPPLTVYGYMYLSTIATFVVPTTTTIAIFILEDV